VIIATVVTYTPAWLASLGRTTVTTAYSLLVNQHKKTVISLIEMDSIVWSKCYDYDLKTSSSTERQTVLNARQSENK